MGLSTFAFQNRYSTHLHDIPSIAPGVEYNTLVREWRCNWSEEGNKASLVTCQIALESILEDVEEIPGFQGIERIVCGSCLEFKVAVSLDAGAFDAWKKDKFTPEKDFLDMLGVIDGISSIETQTYTVRTHIETI
jgi:hypothetical protein